VGERLVRLAIVEIGFLRKISFSWTAAREARAKTLGLDNNKGGKSLYTVSLMPPLMRYAKAKHVCLLGSIAVTFGTLGKLFDRRGLSRI